MPVSLDEIKNGAKTRMGKSLDSLKKDLDKIRTGRAHTGLLDHIQVEYYGTMTPLNQVANLTVEDARTLLVTPWEKNMVIVIDKTIRESDLGLNPATAGQAIRVPMPLLTEERRKELAKLVRSEGENTKVAIRNIRRDSNNHIKELLKKKEISEDNNKRAEDAIQKFTDRYADEVDKMITAKETEIMEV